MFTKFPFITLLSFVLPEFPFLTDSLSKFANCLSKSSSSKMPEVVTVLILLALFAFFFSMSNRSCAFNSTLSASFKFSWSSGESSESRSVPCGLSVVTLPKVFDG